MRGLSERMRRFSGEYVKDFCAAKAALRAGYSESFAKARASELLRDGRVQLLVRELLGDEKGALESREGLRFPSMMEIAGMLGAMAMTSMAEVMSASGEVDRSSPAVRGVRWVKDGEGGLMQEPVLYDRLRAAKEYMKVLAEVAQSGSVRMMDAESWLVHVLGFGWEERARPMERQVSRTAADESVRVELELEDAEVAVTSSAQAQGYRYVAKRSGGGRGEDRRGAAPDPAGEAHLPRPLDTSCRVPEIGGVEAETRGDGADQRGAAPDPAGEAHLAKPLDTSCRVPEIGSSGPDKLWGQGEAGISVGKTDLSTEDLDLRPEAASHSEEKTTEVWTDPSGADDPGEGSDEQEAAQGRGVEGARGVGLQWFGR